MKLGNRVVWANFLKKEFPPRFPHRQNVNYGFQFWVYNVDGESVITMTGYGGFSMSLYRKYRYINLFT